MDTQEHNEPAVAGRIAPACSDDRVQMHHRAVLGPELSAELEQLIERHNRGELWFGHELDDFERRVRGRTFWGRGEGEEQWPIRHRLQGRYLDYLNGRCRDLYSLGLQPVGKMRVEMIPAQLDLRVDRAA